MKRWFILESIIFFIKKMNDKYLFHNESLNNNFNNNFCEYILHIFLYIQ